MMVNGLLVVKSGTDFRQLTEIGIGVAADGPLHIEGYQRHDITASFEEDSVVKAVVDGFSQTMGR